MRELLLVMAGGAAGSGARYLVSRWTLATLGPAFPWGTLTVNVVGSFLMGGLLQFGLSTTLVGPTTRLVLGTGVLGGFTTYSAFTYETLALLQAGDGRAAAANVVVTVVVCLAAGGLGMAAAKLVI